MTADEPGRKVKRRNFVTGFLATSMTALGVAVIFPVIRFLSPPKIPEATGSRVLAGNASELAESGWKIFPFGQEPGILVEVEPGDYRAFAATCTHLDCTVQYDGATRRLWCPCHNGWYDLEGRNVAGPPPRPLTPFEVQVVGDDIFVTRDS